MAFLRRHRLLALWTLFALAAAGMAGAVYRLYATTRREIAAQSRQAVREEQTELLRRLRAYLDGVRHSTVSELLSFHIDGLNPSLRQWDERNTIVVGTFEWDAQRGLVAVSPFPPEAPTPEELVRLWQDFRVWRRSNPAQITTPAVRRGTLETLAFRTVENPDFTGEDTGYQGENVDIITHAGRAADPCAGWAASPDHVQAPWVFWYQLGPAEPVRGCFLDIGRLARQLQAELKPSNTVRLELRHRSTPGGPADSNEVSLDGVLPGYVLSARPGAVFQRKQADARLAASTSALLLGFCVLGGVGLVLLSRKEKRDAEQKVNFVAQVSHELRTPLTSIRMYADLLSKPDLPEAKRLRFSSTIASESARLGAMIENILAFGALQRGETQVQRRPVEISELVRSTVEQMEPLLKEAGLHAMVHVDEAPVWADSDPSTVKQALINLLENAAKYARGSGAVGVRLAREGRSVLVEVADAGPGIPAAIRGTLFEPFVQGGRTLTDKFPGVGLGLSIARGTLRRAGADLVLAPSSTGAVFHIVLPSASPPASS